MEAFLEKMLTNGSPLVVLVVVVFLFLKHMRDASREVQVLLHQFHSDHILARKETKEAVDSNTKAMSENTLAIKALAESVRSCPLK